MGHQALQSNTTGAFNNGFGWHALWQNTTGSSNTAVGDGAGSGPTSGDGNVYAGAGAGSSQTTGSRNVYIGANVLGMAGESDTTRIRNIYSSVATTRAVYVNVDDKIGALSSSRRYKEEIEPMGDASEMLFALKPVTFRYKKESDPARALSFGLIAEDVAETSPELITCDKEGKPETVRYEAVNAMLLNEFLKEHKKVEEQQTAITELKSVVARQQKEFQAAIAEQRQEFAARLKQQEAEIQTVNDRIEFNKVAPQTAASNQ